MDLYSTWSSEQPDPWVTGAMCLVVALTLIAVLLHDWHNDE